MLVHGRMNYDDTRRWSYDASPYSVRKSRQSSHDSGDNESTMV